MGCLNFLKCLMIPQRVILSIMLFLGITVSFTMRACLSVAITEMIVPINKTSKVNEFSSCPADTPPTQYYTTVSHYTHENLERYNWTEEQQGWILSSFYVGYLIAHIPGGLLAEKIGRKLVVSSSVLFSSICNAAIPLAVPYGGIGVLIFIRGLMGLFGGIIFPAVNTLLLAWIPPNERAILGGLALSGPQIGQLLSFYISGQILSFQTWPIVFYFWSIISMIWFIIFMLICSKDPASHRFITKNELSYLKEEIGQLKRKADLPPTPWKSILRSTPVIALIISQMGHDCFFVTLAVGLPKYMREVLGFSVDKAGLYSSLPYIFMWIFSILSGFLCDFLIVRGYLTTVQARKLFTALAGIVPAILLVAASYANCDRLLVVIFLALAMKFMGYYHPGMRVNALDLSPNYTGSMFSVVNGCGAVASAVFPTFIGMMIPNWTLEQWRVVFGTILGIAIVRITIYTIWASGDVQPWNNPKEFKSRECDKLKDNEKNVNFNSDSDFEFQSNSIKTSIPAFKTEKINKIRYEIN